MCVFLFTVGLSAGDSAAAFLNSMRLTVTDVLSGDKLPTLLKRIDYHLDMITRFGNKIAGPNLMSNRETVSILIDKLNFIVNQIR